MPAAVEWRIRYKNKDTFRMHNEGDRKWHCPLVVKQKHEQELAARTWDFGLCAAVIHWEMRNP
jgi:hypothetical protein